MYYIICFLIVLIWSLAAIYFAKLPIQEETRAFLNTLQHEAYKGLSKSDVKYRKKRVKNLPLFDRFLYWLWFWSLIFLLCIGFPLLPSVLRWLVIKYAVCPEGTIFLHIPEGSHLAFICGSFFFGIPFLVAYSYLTNRGRLRKADFVYQMGSFQEYPKKMNIVLSAICGLLGLLIMILPCNSYQYCTKSEIVNKSAFSIHETVYRTGQIDYAEEIETTRTEKDRAITSYKYKIITEDGNSFWLGEEQNDLSTKNVLTQMKIQIVESHTDQH